LPLGALGIAAWAKQEQNWGLFYQTQWPLWLEGLLVVVCMDFLIYLQHVAFHQFGYLWRLHQVHHTDTHLDTSTGIRFHPLEIGISLLYKGICIILLGASLEAVFVFEVLLNGFSLWSHANIDVRSKLDRVLRALWVTPNMHRIHHSVDPRETHQNFGFCLSIWDRVCKTYKSDFEVEGTDLGLPTHRDAKEQKIFKLLVQPWRH
jgi:sterol desaturase/sphingolipid hydroxylase (fatty acid hydroxylase superfamily)